MAWMRWPIVLCVGWFLTTGASTAVAASAEAEFPARPVRMLVHADQMMEASDG